MSTSGVMESITAKVRREERAAFVATCESIGITPSNAIRMFVLAFNQCGGFPFDLSNPYGFSLETLAAMDDADSRRNLTDIFDSVEEMFASLNED